MSKTRLEAFSDAVIAILMTIMVLELKVPHGAGAEALRPLVPVFLTYVLSFVFLGIYWNNHHHLLQACGRIDGRTLWANIHLLFWLSLVPVTTGWMGESRFAPLPTAVYGAVLLLAALAYLILQAVILALEGSGSKLRAAIGSDRKGKLSVACYLMAIPMAFAQEAIAVALYVLVALIWLVPDRRIESALGR